LKTLAATVAPISAAAMLSRKAGEHEDDDEQREGPEPAFRQQFGQHFRDAAVLEMPGQ
jgi:hypothetical protein